MGGMGVGRACGGWGVGVGVRPVQAQQYQVSSKTQHASDRSSTACPRPPQQPPVPQRVPALRAS